MADPLAASWSQLPDELLDGRLLLGGPFAVGRLPGPGFGLVGFPELFQGLVGGLDAFGAGWALG